MERQSTAGGGGGHVEHMGWQRRKETASADRQESRHPESDFGSREGTRLSSCTGQPLEGAKVSGGLPGLCFSRTL